MKSDRVFGLGGRVAAISGTASGIGEAVAHGCACQGATVRCLDVNGDAASFVAGTLLMADGGGRPVQPTGVAASGFGTRHDTGRAYKARPPVAGVGERPQPIAHSRRAIRRGLGFGFLGSRH